RAGGGDLPGAGEADEVIEPGDIEALERDREPPDPPSIAGLSHLLPAIMGVAPALPRGAEIVGRDPGHHLGLALGIELEERARAPDIGAVVRDEDRDIADEPDPPRGRVPA